MIESSTASAPMDLDTLNTPAGKMVGVFLAACPNLDADPGPFQSDLSLQEMRDSVVAAQGRAGLVGRHRLIESLPYFLAADAEWTHGQLIQPLMENSSASIALWRAVARRTQFHKVLEVIGSAMAERVTDARLGRETRGSLAFSLVAEALHALREEREPAVSYARVQQMLRSLDDEVRAHAAGTVGQFLREVSAGGTNDASLSAENLFNLAVAPFLESVWPQEKSLSTPGISKSLVEIPAAAGDQFSAAVRSIERFIVPFDCWSTLDFGLYGDEAGKPKLSQINNKEKAEALLKLMDLSIGTTDGAVVPHDLSDALDQVRDVSAELANSRTYRRLGTLARRS